VFPLFRFLASRIYFILKIMESEEMIGEKDFTSLN